MGRKRKKRKLRAVISAKGKDLIKRRFLHILGAYLAASWGILEFVDWLVNRYVLSKYLVDFSLLILVFMIPSVVLLAYLHGRRGHRWTKLEKIIIPSNILIASILLFFFFHEKDLGSATAAVTLVNEDGEKIERIIPKSEFRKKIFIFFFDNQSEDTTLDWLQYGITSLLGWDLEQDPFLHYLTGRFGLIEAYEPGYSDGIRIPLTLKRKIAKEWQEDYFLAGSFAIKGSGFMVTTSLYDTKRCKLIKKRKFEGGNIFELVDEISVQLKHDLEVPRHYIQNVEDLPVSEMVTNSVSALRKYSLGENASQFDHDYETAAKYFEQAIKEDSTFAIGHLMLRITYEYLQQWEKAEKAMRATVKYMYKLPERSQLFFKELYYDMRGESDKEFALLKMAVALYPDEAWTHSSLAGQYKTRNQLDDALLEYKHALELDPGVYLYLRQIANVYMSKGDFEQALRYYEKYAEQCPDDPRSFKSIGILYRTFGHYDQAKSYFERVLLIEPDNAEALALLADIEIRLGNFGKAFEQLQDALRISESPRFRWAAYDHLRHFCEARGQIAKALEYLDLSLVERKKFFAWEWLELKIRMRFIDLYAKAGREDTAFDIIRRTEEIVGPDDKEWIPRGYMTVYLELKDMENAEKALEQYEKTIEALRFEDQRYIALHARGKIHEMKGEYKQAVEDYIKELEFNPTDWDVNTDIGRCYRNLGNTRRAEKFIKKTLVILPFDAESNYEIALVYADIGNKEKALEHLKTALYVWEDADPNFQPAKKAKQKLQELQH